jgi:hypothetical protein
MLASFWGPPTALPFITVVFISRTVSAARVDGVAVSNQPCHFWPGLSAS